MARYRCKKCNFLYIDEMNEKPFEQVDDSEFKCPRCRCSKGMFEKIG